MSLEPEQITEHVDDLYRYAQGLTHDPDLAADVVHDTVVRALERSDQYRGDAPVKHWLMRIVHNLVIDRSRRSSREIAVEAAAAGWRSSARSPTANDGAR